MPAKKALVIEDSEAVKNIFTKTLQSIGIDVKSTVSGKEALEILKKEVFDLILVDLRLGENIGGFDIIQSLSEKEKKKVIIVSCLSDEAVVEYAGRLKVMTFLQKPVSLESLETAAKNTLTGKRSSFLLIREGFQHINYLVDFFNGKKPAEFVSFLEDQPEKIKKCSLCVSSQDGCNVSCWPFCATASTTVGRVRNFSPREIIQCVQWAIEYNFRDRPEKIKIVAQGMGEPTFNPGIIDAWSFLDKKHPRKFNFKTSTVGVKKPLEFFLKKLEKLNIKSEFQHSHIYADPGKRARFMPGASPIVETLPLLLDYTEIHKVMLTFNYIMQYHLNDSEEDVQQMLILLNQKRILRLMEKGKARIRLSKLNQNKFNREAVPSDIRRIDEIEAELKEKFPFQNSVQRFSSLGPETESGCGQLSGGYGERRLIWISL